MSRVEPKLAATRIAAERFEAASVVFLVGILRRLGEAAPDLVDDFRSAFRETFGAADPGKAVDLCERVLKPDEGWLFDGYVAHAPANWRKLPRNGEPEGVRRCP